MNKFEKVEEIAEKLRQEPYHTLTNDCITKSVRLKRQCRALGIPVRVVVCIGLARARWFGRWMTIPVIHGWGEVEGKRIETSRPLGSSGIWGIVPVNIRPVISVKF
ncbi:MAG: hypothetical protein ABID71_06925 [Chloroflexota bacterium]